MPLHESLHLLTDLDTLADKIISNLDIVLTKKFATVKNIDYTDDNDLSTVLTWIQLSVTTTLTKFTKTLTNQHRKLKTTTVSFIKMKVGDAEYDAAVNEIHIRRAFIVMLTRAIGGRLDEIQANTSGRILSTDIGSSTAVTSTIDRIVSIYAHELTHAIQFARSTIGDEGYRSYLEPDRKAFHDKLENDILDLSYYASPEEIDAYAHGHAMSYILQVDRSLPIAERVAQLKELVQEITTDRTHYAQFVGLPDTISQKVVARYLKKVYQEMMQYIEAIQPQ